MKRREYMKEYRQKNKNKLNDYHKKYYHSKKKKEGDKEEKEDREEIKSIDLSNNNNENDNDKNDHSDNDKNENSDSDSDKNDHSDDDDNDNDSSNEKEHYINISFIIEEMKSLKDELEATRSLLENTNLLVEILNDELVKKHRHIKHLKKEIFTGDNNNEDTQNEDTQNENNQEENNVYDTNTINYDGENDNTYVPELSEKDIMDIDFNANKNNFFTNREYDGLKLKNKEDELKVLKMLKNYEDNIRDKMNEKDKIFIRS